MREEHYMVDDVILPGLALPEPCPVRIDISDDFIRLFVGQRDWQWERGSPEICACGTSLDHPVADKGE
jgi:hypothetical protein